MDPGPPQRVTLPTLQILAAFMSDLSPDDWYGRALSVDTGLGSGTVLQCLYRLENWDWQESRMEDRDLATRDGRPPRRFYRLTGVGQWAAGALLAERFKGELQFVPVLEVLAAAEIGELLGAQRPPSEALISHECQG